MNEQELFQAALEHDPQLRGDFLDEACGDNVQLRQRVMNLLQAGQQSGDFFEKPAAEILATDTSPWLLSTERPGDTIGSYKLREQIGEGGMGLVFVAEQSEPVRRQVALKVCKPGTIAAALTSRTAR